MSRILTAGAFAAASLLFAAPSQAAIIATLTFDTPSATVLSNEAIEVWVTLHLDPMSDAITTDGSGEVTSGLTDQMITDAGFDPDQVFRTNVNNYFECSGTFVSGCGPGPEYAFDFNFAAPSFVGAANRNLLPGSDTSFHFGTFTPIGGNAAPGLYTFYNVGFIFQFTQPDADHPGDNKTGSYTFAQTCPFQNDACAFTREVLAAPGGGVPEPASWALMILGFGGAGVALRRRRAALPA